VDKVLPDLTLLDSRVTPRTYAWDLSFMVYERGTDLYPSTYARTLNRSNVGNVKRERIPLAIEIFQQFQDQLTAGGSAQSARTSLKHVWHFYRWGNTVGRALTLATARKDYLDWCDYRLNQHVNGEISLNALVQSATEIGKILGRALDRGINLIRETRLPSKKLSRNRSNQQSYGDNLSDTMLMGSMLCDLTLALSEDAIRGPLPLTIPIRNGKELKEWCRLTPDEKLTGRRVRRDRMERKQALQADKHWSQRVPLVNLRVEAELMIFIGCTSMNLAQARALKIGNFAYYSYFNGYEVRRLYKDRRKGEVEFRIFSEYREYFDRYLNWRNVFFPNDNRLFPRVGSAGRLEPGHINFTAIRDRCKRLNIPFVSPRILRTTTTNWYLRRTQDPVIVAGMAQHSVETLIQVYERPNHQLAAVEISKFHSLTDPAMAAAGPGLCHAREPAPLSETPSGAPEPDCVGPAGCLFCKQNRDIESMEHIWSLCSFRYLKSLELSKYRQPKGNQLPPPATLVISRLNAKLEAIRRRDGKLSRWVDEAFLRIDEGWYHPAWEGFIKLAEVCK
jgi:hypothetical protein